MKASTMQDLTITITHDDNGIRIIDRHGIEVKHFTEPSYAAFYITNLLVQQAKYLKNVPPMRNVPPMAKARQ